MLNMMSAAKYLLAAVSVFLLGTAAGAFINHAKTGTSYAVPIVLAITGLVAALAAWRLHKLPGKPRK
jgi:uncharacterized membrane-anchored protein